MSKLIVTYLWDCVSCITGGAFITSIEHSPKIINSLLHYLINTSNLYVMSPLFLFCSPVCLLLFRLRITIINAILLYTISRPCIPCILAISMHGLGGWSYKNAWSALSGRWWGRGMTSFYRNICMTSLGQQNVRHELKDDKHVSFREQHRPWHSIRFFWLAIVKKLCKTAFHFKYVLFGLLYYLLISNEISEEIYLILVQLTLYLLSISAVLHPATWHHHYVFCSSTIGNVTIICT